MNNVFNPLISIWLLIGLLFTASGFAAGLDAQLDRTKVVEGDTLVLRLTAPGDSDGTPDLAPLKQDFDVLSQSQSSNFSIINGSTSSTKTWQLVLAPKRPGKLTIPPLSLDGLTSSALNLEVLPADQAAKLGQARPLLLEVEATPQDPYVQGQVIYTVRILSRVSLRQAGLTEPEAQDALIERLGEDKQFNTYRDGQQYQVVERRYAIFPQYSGELEIQAPLLSAQVPDTSRQRPSMRDRMFGGMQDFFGRDPFAGSMFEQTRTVQVRGQNIGLQVRPQPAQAASPWLPAESLSLAENWSTDEIRVGEPVTRTIALTAQGLTAAQLPDLQPGVPDGVKVYPDKPQTTTRTEGGTLVTQKVLKTALLPSRPGELTLPEVRLAWWDTQANQQKLATLPARKIKVLPAAEGSVAARTATPSAAPVPAPVQTLESDGARQEQSPHAQANDSVSQLGQQLIERSDMPAGYWPWISAVLALGWLITIGLWIRARKMAASAGTRQEETAAVAPTPKPSKALNLLEQACKSNDPKAARQALLDWAAASWAEDPPRRLETLGRRLNDNAASLLRALDQELYAPAPQGWKGSAFWQQMSPVLQEQRRSKAKQEPGEILPPLYQQAG